MPKFLMVTVVVFACAIALEMILESYRLVDSIGWWYTALVASVYTAAVMIIIAVGRTVYRKMHRG